MKISLFVFHFSEPTHYVFAPSYASTNLDYLISNIDPKPIMHLY